MSVLEQSPELQPEATPTATHEDESSRTPYPAPRAVPEIEIVDGKIRLAVAYAEPGYYTDVATRHEYVPELGRLVDPYAAPHDPDEGYAPRSGSPYTHPRKAEFAPTRLSTSYLQVSRNALTHIVNEHKTRGY